MLALACGTYKAGSVALSIAVCGHVVQPVRAKLHKRQNAAEALDNCTRGVNRRKVFWIQMVFGGRESTDAVSSDNGMNYSLRWNRAGGISHWLHCGFVFVFGHLLQAFEGRGGTYRIKTQTKVQSSSDHFFFTWAYRLPGKLVWTLHPQEAPSRSKKKQRNNSRKVCVI